MIPSHVQWFLTLGELCGLLYRTSRALVIPMVHRDLLVAMDSLKEAHAESDRYLIVEQLVAKGNLIALEWLITRRSPYPFLKSTWDIAIRLNAIPVLDWLWAHGVPRRYKRMCAVACQHHAINALDWLDARDKAYITLEPEAGTIGATDVLQWYLDHGHTNFQISLACAGAQGHMHVIEWAMRSGVEVDSLVIGYQAATRNRVNMIKFFIDHRFPTHSNWIYGAAMHGHVDLVTYLIAKGVQFHDSDLWRSATDYGQIEILNDLFLFGLQPHPRGARTAVHLGWVDGLRWYFDHDVAPVARHVQLALTKPSVAILELLLEYDVPLTVNLWYDAIDYKNMAGLEWLYANGCPWDETVCARAARCNDFTPIDWLRERRCPWDATTSTIACVDVSMLTHVTGLGCPWDAQTYMMADFVGYKGITPESV
jgi:hypothetical protein